MKIAVVGCGALGSFYGAQLARARRADTFHFLLRSDYDVVRERGVRIRSLHEAPPAARGSARAEAPAVKEEFVVRPVCARSPDEIGPVDLVLIGLKTTANHQFKELLPPLAGPGTTLLTLQNGLGNEEQLAALFPRNRVMGGLCFVCLNRIEPGVILHLAHGKVVLGEHGRPASAETEAVAAMFREAGVPCDVTTNLARTHWEKLVWNVPFNGLGVAGAAGSEAVTVAAGGTLELQGHCLTTDQLLDGGRWEQLVRELMLEVIATANAQGLHIPESVADAQIERTRTMGAYKASTLIDYERGQPLELESLFLEPLRQAQRLKVDTPRLEALCHLLTRGRFSTLPV